MNKILLAGGLAVLALAAASGGAFAQQAPERAPAGVMRADADGDHRLSQAEFVGRRLQRLTAADADRDGSVTAEERRAVAQARQARRAEVRFDRLDADQDGVISKAEFDARRAHRAEARADRGAHRAHHGFAGRHARHIRRDRRAEARGPVAIAEVQARAEAGFARLDADHDGYVTPAEGRAARADRREHRRERMSERHAARRAQQASPPAPASE